MKLITTILCILIMQQISFAQNTFPSEGNVGIGTSSPANKLDVIGGISSSGTSIINGLTFGLANSYTRQLHPSGFNFNILSGDGGSYLALPYSNSAPAHFKNYGLVIDGNVGLGIVNPAYKLEVVTPSTIGMRLQTNASTVGSPQVDFYDAARGAETVISSTDGTTTGTYLASYSNHPLMFGTYAASSGLTKMTLTTLGNLGIGTSAPDNAQNWNRVLNLHGTNHAKLMVTESSGVKVGIYSHAGYNGKIGTESNHNLTFTAGYWNDVMTLTTDSKVGIGTTIPDEKLTVKGKIHAEEVKVDLNVPGPDYVFEKDYDLKSLSHIEKYIAENKHLPEIPSAKAMKENGINVGDMQMKLLQKVEELTLHLIEQNKKIEEQAKSIKRHEDIIETQQEELSKLRTSKSFKNEK